MRAYRFYLYTPMIAPERSLTPLLKKLLTKAFLVSLAFVVLFTVVALLVGENKMTRFDDTVIAYVQGFESPTTTAVMKFFTWIGSGTVVPVLALVVLFVLYKLRRRRADFVFFLGVIFGEAILNVVLKDLFRRARPDLHRLAEASGYSFPSGHSMTAFALYGALTFLLWHQMPSRWAREVTIGISAAMTLLIGISRIYLGVHYPSDVAAGYLASGFWLTAAIWTYQWYREKENQPR